MEPAMGTDPYLPFGSASLRTMVQSPIPWLPGHNDTPRIYAVSPLTAYNSRGRSLCGGKEIKARVHPPETSIVKALCQSEALLLTTSRRPGFSGIQ